jgi:hypothetical protein
MPAPKDFGGCLETEAQHRFGEAKNSNIVTDFEAITGRKRVDKTYSGVNVKINGTISKGNKSRISHLITL